MIPDKREKNKLKGEEEFNKAFSQFIEWDPLGPFSFLEFIECFAMVIFAIIFVILVAIITQNAMFAAASFFLIMFSFVDGWPVNLKKYLPSEKRREAKRKNFRKEYWKFVFKNLPRKAKDDVKAICFKKGYIDDQIIKNKGGTKKWQKKKYQRDK